MYMEGRHVTKRKHYGQCRTCSTHQSIKNDASSSVPTAAGLDSRAPNDQCPCLHKREHDAANKTCYPNPRANDPYAVARAGPYPRNSSCAGCLTNMWRPRQHPTHRGVLNESCCPRRDPYGKNFWREGDCGNGDRVRPTRPNDATSPSNGLERTLGRPETATGPRVSKDSTSWIEPEHVIRLRRPRRLDSRLRRGNLGSHRRDNGLRQWQVVRRQITVTRIEYPQGRGPHASSILDHTR